MFEQSILLSERSYEELALAQPNRPIELHRGRLVEKPPRTIAHDEYVHELYDALRIRLDRRSFRVRMALSRVRLLPNTYVLPDVCIVPMSLIEPHRRRWDVLAVYVEPLVVEIWSPAAGDYDVETKFEEYRKRGDREIWRLHPFELTLTTWVRQADGSYTQTVHRHGIVRPAALPGVDIDLDALFAD